MKTLTPNEVQAIPIETLLEFENITQYRTQVEDWLSTMGEIDEQIAKLISTFMCWFLLGQVLRISGE